MPYNNKMTLSLTMNTGIYCIFNKITKKRYIGSASGKHGFRARWRNHKWRLRNGKHHSLYLQNAWNKYGEDSFEFFAHCTGYEPGELVITVGDVHLYNNQLDQTKELLTRKPYKLPTLKIKNKGQQYLEDFVFEDFEVVNYKYHPKLKADVVVVGGY
jgi:hypothetical protein